VRARGAHAPTGGLLQAREEAAAALPSLWSWQSSRCWWKRGYVAQSHPGSELSTIPLANRKPVES